MRTIQADFLEDRCPCGALLEDGMKRCRKCRARSRWYRHKARGRRSARAGRGASTAPRKEVTQP
jgi:hypothetical protein